MVEYSTGKHMASRAIAVLLMLGAGCSADDTPSRRTLSWRDVDIGGIRFHAARTELQSKLRSIRCERKAYDTEICTWSPKAREGAFKGIDRILLTIWRDSVHGIELRYGEMFDVDYRTFDKEMRRKYAGRQAAPGLDTVACEWRSDSLIVRLSPNRRQHWTGTFYVFTPTVEFQERERGKP